MNLQSLKWTKNVKLKNEEPWAYQAFKVRNLFKLAWKDDEGNANKPQQGDLILTRQSGYVTHLVKIQPVPELLGTSRTLKLGRRWAKPYLMIEGRAVIQKLETIQKLKL